MNSHRKGRPLSAEAGERLRQDTGTGKRQGTDHDRPGLPAIELGQFRIGLVEFIDRQPHRLGKRLAEPGRQDAEGSALEQAARRRLLDLRHGAMDSRLGKPEAAGGKREILTLADGDQRLKLRVAQGHAQPRRNIIQHWIEQAKGAFDTLQQHLSARREEKRRDGSSRTGRRQLPAPAC